MARAPAVRLRVGISGAREGWCRRFEVPIAVAADSCRNFKSKSGTRIIEVLVPLCFRSSSQGRCKVFTNFGSGALGEMAKTVMIVEDNELNMKLFHDLLEAHGYSTVGTRSGTEALDLAREHHPDLILMDIQLPEVSGLEVTKWLKGDPDLQGIPVVAVTAFAMKGDEEGIREGGCEAYLSKPISVGKFIETVRHFLGPA